MHFRPFHRVVFIALFSLASLAARADLPKRDFKIELRQIEQGDSGAYSVNTRPSVPLLLDQSVKVRNGEKASLRFNVSMPMQWIQKIESQTSSINVAGTAIQSSGVGLSNAITWMDAGQSLTVTPRWAGGKQPVKLEIDIQSASVDERVGSELPNQTRGQVTTVMSAPLGEWVTVATSGERDQPGVYSSSASGTVPRIVQIRVSLN
jgi:hypothetical protein